MSNMLVGIEEVLVRLRDRGPLPTADIARLFGLNPVDARLLMLHAHVRGQVRRNDWGEWTITERGREAIAAIASQRAEDSRRMARGLEALRTLGRGMGWQRGAVLVACAASSAVVAAVAGAFAGTASQPTASSTYRYADQRVAGRNGPKHARSAKHSRRLVAISERRSVNRVVIASLHGHRFLRQGARTPLFEAYAARSSSIAGKASAARTGVRMEAVRSSGAKGRSSCTSAGRGRSSKSHCSSSTGSGSGSGAGAGKRAGAAGSSGAPAR